MPRPSKTTGRLPAGLFYEDFTLGRSFESFGRTLTDADLVLFAGLSGDFNPVHLDQETAQATPFRGRVAHGMLVQSIATGLAVQMGIFHGTLVALASMEIAWKTPARVGDTIRVIMEVADVDSNPKSRRGTVEFQVQVIKADDTVLVESRWQTVVSRRPKSTN